MNIIFEYCHASVILDNLDVLYLEDGNVCNPDLKKNRNYDFFLKKPFLVFHFFSPEFEKYENIKKSKIKFSLVSFTNYVIIKNTFSKKINVISDFFLNFNL